MPSYITVEEAGVRLDKLTDRVVMKLLPRDQRRMKFCDAEHVLIGAHENQHGYLHWVKTPVSDLPNDLASLDDLKRFGIDIVDGIAVRKNK